MNGYSKSKVIDLENIYTVNAFQQCGRMMIGAGPEREGNPLLVDFSTLEKEEAGESLGGMMSFVPVPGQNSEYVSVMGLFPPFKGLEGGIFLHAKESDGWKVTKVIKLPFAHRCDILHKNGKNYLFSATVSTFKQDPADWSHPGEVFITEIPSGDDASKLWPKTKVIDNLFRNHGMTRAVIDGSEVIAVSGTEGIFALDVDDRGEVIVTKLFDREVSEFAWVDINGDGQDELATIEAFHGTTLNIYTHRDGEWQRIFQGELEFGHGLCAGYVNGRALVVAANRRGECNVNYYAFNPITGRVEEHVLDTGTGTTQSQIFSFDGKDYILCANQNKHEAAVYTAE